MLTTPTPPRNGSADAHCGGYRAWRSRGRATSGATFDYSAVPHGVAVFPGDGGVRRIAEREHNVVHWSEFDRGGHFAAMEAPGLLVADIRTFFRPLR